MPSKTFLNLSKEKQEKIIQCALTEFSDNPFSEVSINKIVKNSEISRGSFYTYFADKYDLLVYLLDLFKDKMRNKMFEFNQGFQVDLKSLIVGTHQHIFELYQNQTNKKFLFNVIVYFHTHSDEELKSQREQLSFLGDCNEIYNILDLKQFKFTSEKAIKQTIDIAFSILKNVLFISATKKLDYHKSKTLLEDYLNILEQGYREAHNA
ncbi:MAG: TetR/AcrR family transcriptional regulator [Candidatus Izemoplasmatales bacterium]